MATIPEYTGLKARAWDALRGDTSSWDDRAFFLEVTKELGEPVLDVGCGTGRMLLDFLALGIDIDGVEISPDMLAILRAKADAAGLDVAGRIHEAAWQRWTWDAGTADPRPVVLVPVADRPERRHGRHAALPRPSRARRDAGHALDRYRQGLSRAGMTRARRRLRSRRIAHPSRVSRMVRSGDGPGAHRGSLRTADRRRSRGGGADRSFAGDAPVRPGSDPECSRCGRDSWN